MTYWKFAPGEGADNWDTQRDAGYIGIGWHELGNILECTKEEYDRRRTQQARLRNVNAFDGHRNVWSFIHAIAIGDIIVANKGLHRIVGIGLVTGDAIFHVDVNVKYPTRRAVDWIYANNDGLPLPSGQFTQSTLTRIRNPGWIKLVQDLLAIKK